MKKRSCCLVILNFLLSFFSFFVEADQYNIPPSIRFTVEREKGALPIVYYFSPPDTTFDSYPILILCEGSSSKGNVGSVFFIREYFASRIQPLQVGYLTVEKWGVDGNNIDENEFWNHYSRSQRLEDHLSVIRHLENEPPNGWNGKFIFIGVSEGGPLVTDLSIFCPDTIATVNWVGAGDWNWADELWQFFESWKNTSFWMRLYDAIPRWCPFSSDMPQSREEYDELVQHIILNPAVDKSLAGMTYFYHADAFQKPAIDYSKIHAPFLVVEGTEDSAIISCDQFVQKAMTLNAPITYLRIEGMDHWIRKRPDVIDQSFEWLKNQLAAEGALVNMNFQHEKAAILEVDMLINHSRIKS
jgi:pimeloyl-ACP methyl ester carboxylesterase